MTEFNLKQLREELLLTLRKMDDSQNIVLRTAVLSAFRFGGREIRFSSRHFEFAEFLAELIRARYKVDCQISKNKKQSTLRLEDIALSREMREDMEDFAAEGFSLYFSNRQAEGFRERVLLALASLFLACGSLASPEDSYQIEFATQRPSAMTFYAQLFELVNLPVKTLRHQGYYVLYLKDGQSVSDFLLYAGANKALLDFEATRVQKEMFNQVNRVVNCDSANAQRVANSSARHRHAIRRLQEAGKFDALPPQLRLTAHLRLENPELSLKELGDMLDPPLGKSGVNHRLQKILRLADEL